MSSLGRLFAALLVVICVTAAIFVAGLVLTIDGLRRDLAALFSSTDAATAPVDTASLPRLHFLSGVDFDAGPVRLVLEPSLTGTETLVIDDQSLLPAMAATASIPDLGIGGPQSLLAAALGGRKILDRVPALRLYQNGLLLSAEFCLPQLCLTDAQTRSELAPLIAGASGRVVTHSQTFTDHAAYAAAFAKAKTARLLTDLPQSPMPASRTPVHFSITLPAVALQDRDDYRDKVSDAITAAVGGNVFVHVDARAQPTGIDLYDLCNGEKLAAPPITLLTAEGRTDAEGYARLAAITDWSFLPQPPALPAESQARTGAAGIPPECLRIGAKDGPPLRGPIVLSPPEYQQYHLTWDEILPLRDDDGSAVLE